MLLDRWGREGKEDQNSNYLLSNLSLRVTYLLQLIDVNMSTQSIFRLYIMAFPLQKSTLAKVIPRRKHSELHSTKVPSLFSLAQCIMQFTVVLILRIHTFLVHFKLHSHSIQHCSSDYSEEFLWNFMFNDL